MSSPAPAVGPIRPSARGGVRVLSLLGPAVLISVGYMDPGNWATDLAGGSQFGYTLLWVLLVSNLMALLLQHLSAKLGLATGLSYPQLCRARFPRPIALGLWLTAEAAAIATDLAEFLGAALGFYLLLRIPLFEAALLTAVAVFGILGLYRIGYRWVELAVFGLVAIIGGAYVLEVWLVGPEWGAVAAGVVIPSLQPGALPIAMGMLGATVMPHNLYLHSSVVLSRRRDDEAVNRRTVRRSIIASAIALNLAWLVNSAIVITAAGAFGSAGIAIDSIEVAHETLTPLLGAAAATAFAIALLAAGLSSSTTATLAGQVIIEGFLGIRFGLFVRRAITVVPAIVVIAIGVDAFTILIVSQVALSIQLPFAIIPLVWLTSRREVMGGYVNRRATTVAAALCGGVIVVLNVWLLGGLLLGG
ncbi:MAG: Nramp family divalent metal transporter [Candidatus Limnocylindrales bacterium]